MIMLGIYSIILFLFTFIVTWFNSLIHCNLLDYLLLFHKD